LGAGGKIGEPAADLIDAICFHVCEILVSRGF
jgi:hypothetical protein